MNRLLLEQAADDPAPTKDYVSLTGVMDCTLTIPLSSIRQAPREDLWLPHPHADAQRPQRAGSTQEEGPCQHLPCQREEVWWQEVDSLAECDVLGVGGNAALEAQLWSIPGLLQR